MDDSLLQLPPGFRHIVDRFVAACQADDRIVAAFLGGSYAAGLADPYSDLDLYFVTTDEAYAALVGERADFVRQLGEPLFLDDFGLEHGYCFILADGSAGEFWFGPESRVQQIHSGPFTVLVDKNGCLTDVQFPVHRASVTSQTDALHNQINAFWHELSHFITALGREQLWFAYGQLEMLRQICVSLARLNHNFADAYASKEPYFKVDQALPAETLTPLGKTFCPMAYPAMLEAAFTICDYYRAVAPALAVQHNLTYQIRLEEQMLGQLAALRDRGQSAATRVPDAAA